MARVARDVIGDGFVADDFGFAVVLRIVELHLFENIKVDVLASDVAHLHLAERGPEVLANDALVALLAALQGGSTFEPMAFRKPKVIVLGKDYRYLRNEDEIQRFLRAARDARIRRRTGIRRRCAAAGRAASGKTGDGNEGDEN